MNTVTLFGRIHTTPELLDLAGTAFVTFLFTTFKRYDDPDVPILETTYHRVAAHGPLADALGRLSAGTTLFIRGELTTRLIGTAEDPRVDATVMASTVQVYPAHRFENVPTIEALAAEITGAAV